jgi:site-specific DNA-methyltransferase (adenine-specific)
MKKYQIIYADPAWSYSDQGCSGTMADHYKGMAIEDICSLPVGGVCDENCVLFLWATYPMIPEALMVIKAWGFTYKSIAFQWIKLNKHAGKQFSFIQNKYFYGLGRWTRGNTEPCLLATKGKPKRISASVHQIIEAPLTRHSEKPQEARDKIIQLMGDLPRIELFARQKTEGWDVWGNEVESDINLEIANAIH